MTLIQKLLFLIKLVLISQLVFAVISFMFALLSPDSQWYAITIGLLLSLGIVLWFIVTMYVIAVTAQDNKIRKGDKYHG